MLSDSPHAYRTWTDKIRRVYYEFDTDTPWNGERIVKRPDRTSVWEVGGRASLAELHIDGAGRATVRSRGA